MNSSRGRLTRPAGTDEAAGQVAVVMLRRTWTLAEGVGRYDLVRGVTVLPTLLKELGARFTEDLTMSGNVIGLGNQCFMGVKACEPLERPLGNIGTGCALLRLAIVVNYAWPSAAAAGLAIRGSTSDIPISDANLGLLDTRAHSAPACAAEPMSRACRMPISMRHEGNEERNGQTASVLIGGSSSNGCAREPARKARAG